MIRRSLWTLAAAGTFAACGGSGRTTVDVLAASSFTDVSQPLETLLETELDVDIRFSFGSSGTFFEQLDQGAPASVVITANAATMARMEAAGLVEASVPISTNQLVVVTADTSAGRRITTLEDLASVDAIIVLCVESAPCGEATDELLRRAGVELSPASREPNVRATLTKVLLGEADAALVYRTDAAAHPELRSIVIDDALNPPVVGRAAAVAGDATGAAVVAVLTTPEAVEVLRTAGFGTP